MKKPIKGMKYKPYGREIMTGAWLDFVVYATSIEEHRNQFKEETGFDISHVLKSKGINKMIDQATGYEKKVIIEWADWVTKNLWGIN